MLSTYLVLAESRLCIERKVPLARLASISESDIKIYTNDMMILPHAEGCEGVLKFVGVAVDDQRTHVKSYLQESGVGSLKNVMDTAMAKDIVLS